VILDRWDNDINASWVILTLEVLVTSSGIRSMVELLVLFCSYYIVPGITMIWTIIIGWQRNQSKYIQFVVVNILKCISSIAVILDRLDNDINASWVILTLEVLVTSSGIRSMVELLVLFYQLHLHNSEEVELGCDGVFLREIKLTAMIYLNYC
jgi:hypothetical protein